MPLLLRLLVIIFAAIDTINTFIIAIYILRLLDIAFHCRFRHCFAMSLLLLSTPLRIRCLDADTWYYCITAIMPVRHCHYAAAWYITYAAFIVTRRATLRHYDASLLRHRGASLATPAPLLRCFDIALSCRSLRVTTMLMPLRHAAIDTFTPPRHYALRYITLIFDHMTSSIIT